VETAAAKQKTSGGKNASSAGSTKTYKVKKGDTLFGIAARFNVPVDKLRQANHLKTNEIKYGTTLKIPAQG
jgi:membrane-bound lytic murein transglycosylase D